MLVQLCLNPGDKAGKRSAGVRWMKFFFAMAQSSAQTALINRVAIALSEAAQAALSAWEPISSRHSSLCFYLDAEEEVKDSFYDDLQGAVDRVPAGDMRIVAGDGGARPGPVDMTTRQVCRGFDVC